MCAIYGAINTFICTINVTSDRGPNAILRHIDWGMLSRSREVILFLYLALQNVLVSVLQEGCCSVGKDSKNSRINDDKMG